MIFQSSFALRVNGMPITNLKVRRVLRDGSYTNQNELVIFDPIIGPFPLDYTFEIEMRDLPDGEWAMISSDALYKKLAAFIPLENSSSTRL